LNKKTISNLAENKPEKGCQTFKYS